MRSVLGRPQKTYLIRHRTIVRHYKDQWSFQFCLSCAGMRTVVWVHRSHLVFSAQMVNYELRLCIRDGNLESISVSTRNHKSHGPPKSTLCKPHCGSSSQLRYRKKYQPFGANQYLKPDCNLPFDRGVKMRRAIKISNGFASTSSYFQIKNWKRVFEVKCLPRQQFRSTKSRILQAISYSPDSNTSLPSGKYFQGPSCLFK